MSSPIGLPALIVSKNAFVKGRVRGRRRGGKGAKFARNYH